MKIIFWPDEEDIKSKLVGGKALNLICLKEHGFTVPDFFVVSTQVFNSLSEQVEKEILKNYSKLDSPHVAVRSSATCEDSKNSSFAGQFESYLSVSKEDVVKKVKRCWASTSSSRVLSYATHHHLCLSSIKMAVIIQKMIFAKKGGVVFTKDIFNKGNSLIIEAAKGLGENIVSALVDPERIIVEKSSGKIMQKDSPEEEVLTKKEIEELTKLSLAIEKVFCYPQDIEWAIKDNKIYVLQSRPIST